MDYLTYRRTTHGITILYQIHQCRPYTARAILRAKVCKGGIKSVIEGGFTRYGELYSTLLSGPKFVCYTILS